MCVADCIGRAAHASAICDMLTRLVPSRLTLPCAACTIRQGKEISAVLGQPPGKLGRLLAVLLSRVVEWQLDNPAGGKEACGEYIKAELEAGRVALPDEPAPAQKQPVAKPPKKKRKDSLT